MAEVVLNKLKFGDEEFLQYLMTSDQEIIEFSLKSDLSKWRKMVEWSVKNPKDLFWKITVNDGDGFIDCGYIGFTPAKGKLAMEPIAKKIADTDDLKHLVLEIYILKEYRGRDIGTVAYNQAIELIKEIYPQTKITVYASTYNTNMRAQRFFLDSLNMELSHYFSSVSTVFKKTYFLENN